MQFNILVTGGLYATQSGYSALRFCKAALAAGHSISQVFFYQDGVSQASILSIPLEDEFEAVSDWAEFALQGQTDLVVCVSAAERRGILSAEQAQEFGKQAANLHPAFKVAGLGVLHEASLASERLVSFK